MHNLIYEPHTHTHTHTPPPHTASDMHNRIYEPHTHTHHPLTLLVISTISYMNHTHTHAHTPGRMCSHPPSAYRRALSPQQWLCLSQCYLVQCQWCYSWRKLRRSPWVLVQCWHALASHSQRQWDASNCAGGLLANAHHQNLSKTTTTHEVTMYMLCTHSDVHVNVHVTNKQALWEQSLLACTHSWLTCTTHHTDRVVPGTATTIPNLSLSLDVLSPSTGSRIATNPPAYPQAL